MDTVQRARRPAGEEEEEEGSRRFPPTVNELLKAEQLHHGVLRQLPGVGVGHVGIAGAGKDVAPVLPPGVDTSVLDLQQQTILDAPQDTVGVFNLIPSNNNAIIEQFSRGKLNTTLVMDVLRLMGDIDSHHSSSTHTTIIRSKFSADLNCFYVLLFKIPAMHKFPFKPLDTLYNSLVLASHDMQFDKALF